jgi:nitrogen fixation NifU-like protein
VSFYREIILDHYHHPRNAGHIIKPDCRSHLDNPLCGDSIDIHLKIKDNKIKDIKFNATGCAISIAAISMLSEKIKGMEINMVKDLSFDYIKDMLGIDLGMARVKCAMLGLNVVKDCLEKLK